MNATGFVHSFETLGALDGPGLRCVVFLQGCPLRCIYCHNPDTWQPYAGTVMTAAEVAAKAARCKPYFGKNGGVTLSGGEPLLQGGFCTEVIKLLKDNGIHTAIDTSGAVFHRAAVDVADLIILDVKHTDADEYKKITGLEMNAELLEYCKSTQKPLWIRQVILPGYTDSEEYMQSLAAFVKGANAKKIELLPYHDLGVGKYEKLGIEYKLKAAKPVSAEEAERLYSFLSEHM